MKKFLCVALAVTLLFSCVQAMALDLNAGYDAHIILEVNRDELIQQVLGGSADYQEEDPVIDAVVSMLNNLTVDAWMDEKQNMLLDMKIHGNTFATMTYQHSGGEQMLLMMDVMPDTVLAMPAGTTAVPEYEYDEVMALWQETLDDCTEIFFRGLIAIAGEEGTEEICEQEIQGMTFNRVTICETTGAQLKSNLDNMLAAIDREMTSYYEAMGMAASWEVTKKQFREMLLFPEELAEVPVLAQRYRVLEEDGFVPDCFAGDILLMSEETVRFQYFLDGEKMDFLLEGNGMVEYREEQTSPYAITRIVGDNVTLMVNEENYGEDKIYTDYVNQQREYYIQQEYQVDIIEMSVDDMEKVYADTQPGGMYSDERLEKMPYSYHVYGKLPSLQHMDMNVDVTVNGIFCGLGVQVNDGDENTEYQIGLSLNEYAKEPLLKLHINMMPWQGEVEEVDTDGKVLVDMLNMDRETEEQFNLAAAQAGMNLLLKMILAAPEEMRVILGESW